MSKFHEGPANGQVLQLRRAPRFLRIVVDPAGKVDGLDQLDDTPADNETIHVYERQTEPVRAHLNFGGGRGGWFEMADYAHFPQQPQDHEVRATDAWQAWVQATSKRLDDE